jgi:hypothetical protein
MAHASGRLAISLTAVPVLLSKAAFPSFGFSTLNPNKPAPDDRQVLDLGLAAPSS